MALTRVSTFSSKKNSPWCNDAPPVEEKKKDDPYARYDNQPWAGAEVAHEIHDIDPEVQKRVEKIYGDWADANPNAAMDEVVMKKLYLAGGFHVVKSILEKQQRVISLEHSMQMADLRILICMRAAERVLQKHDGKWKIYRSDSGNQNSGMSSDIDQTIYVYEYDETTRQWRRNEKLDSQFIREFTEAFKETTADPKNNVAGLDVSHLDVATIAGRDRFPDWRLATSQLDVEARRSGARPFLEHAVATVEGLRDTPGAYTYCGAVVQQMQLRVLKGIMESLKIGPDATDPADAHVIKTKVDGKEVDQRIEIDPRLTKAGLRWLVCCEFMLDPATKTIVPREVFQSTDSPDRPGAIQVMFDGLAPKLVRGHAYDAAVANYLEFMHHLRDTRRLSITSAPSTTASGSSMPLRRGRAARRRRRFTRS